MKVRLLPSANFSGRTAALKDIAGFHGDAIAQQSRAQYIGPDVDNFLSGLAQTVEDELSLHNRCWRRHDLCRAILGLANVDRMPTRNPYTLSGGEQTVLALATALCRNPQELLIDCALEQLAPAARLDALRCLGEALDAPRVSLADSRIDEYIDSMDVGDRMATAPDPRPKPELDSGSYLPHPATPTAITLYDVWFSYEPDCPVIARLSLTLEPGNIYFLRGPNGVGKTTLCRLLAGLIRPINGGIFVNGVERDLTQAPAAVCALHFQNPDPQLFETTVEGELLASVSSDAGSSHAPMLLAAFGLEDLKSAHPMDLPFVLRKRLAIAATFAMQRPWLILDEPSLGQDCDTLDQLVEMLRMQANAGCGVIVVTHSERLVSDAHTITVEPTGVS